MSVVDVCGKEDSDEIGKEMDKMLGSENHKLLRARDSFIRFIREQNLSPNEKDVVIGGFLTGIYFCYESLRQQGLAYRLEDQFKK